MLFVGAAGSSTCRCRDTTGLMLVLLGAVFEEGGVSWIYERYYCILYLLLFTTGSRLPHWTCIFQPP